MAERISHDPEVWQERADHLAALLTDLAQLRSNATVTHAEAYLAKEGTDRAREQAAKLAAASDHLAAERAAAMVAAYQVMLTLWQADLASAGALGPPLLDESVPEPLRRNGGR